MGHEKYTYGEPGFYANDPIESVTPKTFISLCKQVREAKDGNTSKEEWVIRAADTTVLSFELSTYDSQGKANMAFVLRRDGVVVVEEIHDELAAIHRFLAKEKLHTLAETALDEYLNPPAP